MDSPSTVEWNHFGGNLWPPGPFFVTALAAAVNAAQRATTKRLAKSDEIDTRTGAA
jgi:hypothetical protein